jgi:hypothetical protein
MVTAKSWRQVVCDVFLPLLAAAGVVVHHPAVVKKYGRSGRYDEVGLQGLDVESLWKSVEVG